MKTDNKHRENSWVCNGACKKIVSFDSIYHLMLINHNSTWIWNQLNCTSKKWYVNRNQGLNGRESLYQCNDNAFKFETIFCLKTDNQSLLCVHYILWILCFITWICKAQLKWYWIIWNWINFWKYGIIAIIIVIIDINVYYLIQLI